MPTTLEFTSPPEISTFSVPLKWAGGKRWLVPYLRSIWSGHCDRRLVEPFCGGLSVALGLQPDEALLNDINPHLINFYEHLQQGLELTFTWRNEEESFYEARRRFNDLIELGEPHTSEAAQLFYYLNRTGYNGLCRFNQSGFFNVPFGRYKTINYRPDFEPYRMKLAGWQFSQVDFEDLDLEPDDFIYSDPPYDADFTQYSQQGFDWADQVRLVEWLSKHPGPVVLSNQATERVVELYEERNFDLKFFQAPRRISCNGDRDTVREVLATRNM